MRTKSAGTGAVDAMGQAPTREVEPQAVADDHLAADDFRDLALDVAEPPRSLKKASGRKREGRGLKEGVTRTGRRKVVGLEARRALAVVRHGVGGGHIFLVNNGAPVVHNSNPSAQSG